MVGLLASLKFPHLIDKLILIAPSPCYIDGDNYKGGFSAEQVEFLLAGMKQNYEAWAAGFSAFVFRHAADENLIQRFSASLGGMRPDIALAKAEVIFKSDYRHLLKQVVTPTLILQTMDDPAVPREVSAYLLKHIPGSHLQVIPTYGHHPHLTAPAEVVAAIKAFLN
jgi:sigma-B regulation protein RsbQ